MTQLVTRKSRWLVMAGGLGALIACAQPPPTEPTTDALVDALKTPQPTAGVPVAARPPLQIYVDASRSMQGFLNVPHGRFRRALDQLLDRSVAGGYDVSVFKFDESVRSLPGTVSTAMMLRSDFFVGGETSFPVLFNHIRKQRKPGSIAVVVTDLVQSGRTGEQRELSRAFQELATDRPEVLLVALRSPFVGPYWPESTLERDYLRVDLRGQDVRNSRPFYLLAITDRAEELDVLRRHLELTDDPGSTTSWEIDAARPAILVKEVSFAPRANGPEAKVWQVHRRAQELPPLGRTNRTALWLFERNPPPAGGAPVRLRFALDGKIGVEELAGVSAEARRCRFTANGSCAEAEAVALSVQVVGPDESGNLIASYALPRPPERTWDGYQVRLLPGRANLVRPINAELWTTDDDSDLQSATRTFKLHLFVDTLTNALREPVAFSEQFIFLGRGN